MKSIIPKNQEPHPSYGGTFIRDKEGNLLKHIPPTKGHTSAAAEEPAQPAEDSPTAAETPADATAAPTKVAARAPAKKR